MESYHYFTHSFIRLLSSGRRDIQYIYYTANSFSSMVRSPAKQALDIKIDTTRRVRGGSVRMSHPGEPYIACSPLLFSFCRLGNHQRQHP